MNTFDKSKPKFKKRKKTGFRKWEGETPRKDKVSHVGSVLDGLVRYLGVGKRLEEQQAVLIWDKVVGETIAAVTQVHSMKDGDLTVKVSNPTWRTELSFRKEEILTSINRALGKHVVSNIRFK